MHFKKEETLAILFFIIYMGTIPAHLLHIFVDIDERYANRRRASPSSPYIQHPEMISSLIYKELHTISNFPSIPNFP